MTNPPELQNPTCDDADAPRGGASAPAADCPPAAAGTPDLCNVISMVAEKRRRDATFDFHERMLRKGLALVENAQAIDGLVVAPVWKMADGRTRINADFRFPDSYLVEGWKAYLISHGTQVAKDALASLIELGLDRDRYIRLLKERGLDWIVEVLA